MLPIPTEFTLLFAKVNTELYGIERILKKKQLRYNNALVKMQKELQAFF